MSTRGASLISGALGIAIGIGIGWYLMLQEGNRQLAIAEAANASNNIRVLDALQQQDLDSALEIVKTGLIGNIVVLTAWAEGAELAPDDFPAKILRRIARLDAEISIFEDPELKDYLIRFSTEF